MSLDSILESINGLSENELLTLNGCVVQNIKAIRTKRMIVVRDALKPGDTVTFTGREAGRGGKRFPVTGTIVRVKRKRAEVSARGTTWNVPITAITKAEAQ